MLKAASKIFREYDNADDEMLIHGIIDGYLETADEVLLYDFKTDFVFNGDIEVMRQRYQGQLSLYKQALEQALQKPVTRTVLIWLPQRKIIDL